MGYVNTYRIGQAEVEILPNGVHTSFPDGEEVYAYTETGDKWAEQLGYARALGYEGTDEEAVDQMNREHDLCHSLLAHALGDEYCPVLYGVAVRNYVPKALSDERERIVFLMQKLLHAGLEETARYVDEVSRG